MNKPKGDHKHLTLSQRIEIEKRLLANHSFTDIARSLGKDPTTISKEIRRNSEIKQRASGIQSRTLNYSCLFAAQKNPFFLC